MQKLKHIPTENEIKALLCCINPEAGVDGMMEDQAQCLAGFDEFKEALGWNRKQVAALICSLEKKGYGYGDDNEGNGHIFWPSREGYEVAFDALNSRKEA
jgi:hypothetical protein